MTDWFTVKIKYLKQNPENGSIQSKSEAYMLNALSFTEAEARLQGILEEYIPEYNLLACAKTNIQDVIVDEAFDYFYKVKVSYISADPDSGKEKKINGRLTDVRRGAGCITLFENFPIGEPLLVLLKTDFRELDFKVEIVSRREVLMGRGVTYGVRFAFRSEDEKEGFKRIKTNCIRFWCIVN